MERFPLRKTYWKYINKQEKEKRKNNGWGDFIENKLSKRMKVLLVILTLAILVVIWGIKSAVPVFMQLIENKAQSIAISISNNAIKTKLKDINYSELIIFNKDESGKISMISANTYVMNQIANEISLLIEEEIEALDEIVVKLPIGAFLGSNVFVNIGPSIEIEILPVGTLKTNFKSEVISSGINQTIHKIYVEVVCNVRIITPFASKNASFVNNILVSEVVIVGEVPSSFYHLEGLGVSDTLNILE